VISETAKLFASAGGVRPWFQIDREGDSLPTLMTLLDSDHLFTVRASWNRRLHTKDGEPRIYVRDVIDAAPKRFTHYIDVTAGPKRTARRAHLAVRAVQVEISMKDKWHQKCHNRMVNSIQLMEVGTTPKGEKPIEWTLWTNHSIATKKDLIRIIFGYTQRWRIEELHRAWKSVCNVEDTQLHKRAHVIKWATILLTVAARAERLKRLLRERPDAPANDEFTPTELKAIHLLRRRHNRRLKQIPDDQLTLSQAVVWVAELGGYTGKSSGGPPGAVTISRGLEKVMLAATVLDELGQK
jgi:hypothetical protein